MSMVDPEGRGLPLAMRHVARQSGFTPLQLSPVAYYDLSDITTLWKDTGRTSAVTANADMIKGVTDKSGHGWHLSEATNGPAYTTGAQNGLSVARFVGASSQKLSMAVGGWSTLTQPLTIAWVGKATTTAATQIFIDSTDVNRCAFFLNSTGPAWTAFATSSQNFTGAPPANTSFHSFILVFNGASTTLTLDGTIYTVAANSGGNAAGPPLLGVAQGGATFFLTGDIGEALWCSGAMPAADRASLRAYWLSKWNA